MVAGWLSDAAAGAGGIGVKGSTESPRSKTGIQYGWWPGAKNRRDQTRGVTSIFSWMKAPCWRGSLCPTPERWLDRRGGDGAPGWRASPFSGKRSSMVCFHRHCWSCIGSKAWFS